MERQLKPCRRKPNCVSSQADPKDRIHFIEPLELGSLEPAAALSQLERLLKSLRGVGVVAIEGNYLHTTFQSRLFRFVDDVEFLVAADEDVIHCRSASRVGTQDLGANRRRIEAIRRAWRLIEAVV